MNNIVSSLDEILAKVEETILKPEEGVIGYNGPEKQVSSRYNFIRSDFFSCTPGIEKRFEGMVFSHESPKELLTLDVTRFEEGYSLKMFTPEGAHLVIDYIFENEVDKFGARQTPGGTNYDQNNLEIVLQPCQNALKIITDSFIPSAFVRID